MRLRFEREEYSDFYARPDFQKPDVCVAFNSGAGDVSSGGVERWTPQVHYEPLLFT